MPHPESSPLCFGGRWQILLEVEPREMMIRSLDRLPLGGINVVPLEPWLVPVRASFYLKKRKGVVLGYLFIFLFCPVMSLASIIQLHPSLDTDKRIKPPYLGLSASKMRSKVNLSSLQNIQFEVSLFVYLFVLFFPGRVSL